MISLVRFVVAKEGVKEREGGRQRDRQWKEREGGRQRGTREREGGRETERQTVERGRDWRKRGTREREGPENGRESERH